jgi:hypothetical protein
MRRLFPAVAALALLLSTPARAEDNAEARAACEKVLPDSTVSKALGRTVKLEGMMAIGLVVMCGYVVGDVPLVTVQLSPKITKQQYQDLYVASAQGKGKKPLAGVGDEAYTMVQPALVGGGTSTSVCGRKNDAAFCVSQGLDPDSAKGLDPSTLKVFGSEASVLAVAKALVTKL